MAIMRDKRGVPTDTGSVDTGSTDTGSTDTSASATSTTDPQASAPSSTSTPPPAASTPRPTTQPTLTEDSPPVSGRPADATESPYDRAVKELKQGWLETQAELLDDPRDAVSKADSMIDEVMKHFAASVSSHRSEIHRRWAEDDRLSTDELRTTMQAYRSLFQHIMGSASISAPPEPKA